METENFWVSPEMGVGEFRVSFSWCRSGNRSVKEINQNIAMDTIGASDSAQEFPGTVGMVPGPCCTAMALHLDQNSLTVSLKDVTLRAFLHARFSREGK
jgi:hypothetical protein